MATTDTETETETIVAFLRGIGLEVREAPLDDDTFLPGLAVRDGVLLYDPARLHPGDLLHEAGHVAVLEPELRATTSDFQNDGGQEMAAIGWSYAAALAAGIDPRVVFHDDGYRDGGEHLADTFASGGFIGLPLLQWYGLAARADEDHPPYPAMKRWLR